MQLSVNQEKKMTLFSIRNWSRCVIIPAALALASPAFAADTHAIVAHSNLTWVYNGQSSAQNKPLMVNDLNAGDIIDVQVPGGTHGFIPIKKQAGSSPVETKDPIILCSDPAGSKPNAVLREINCAADTQVGKPYVGSLKLEVLPTFHDPVDFWCWVHKALMPGTLALKAATPSPALLKK
jgi:hypothetical protein